MLMDVIPYFSSSAVDKTFWAPLPVQMLHKVVFFFSKKIQAHMYESTGSYCCNEHRCHRGRYRGHWRHTLIYHLYGQVLFYSYMKI